MKRIRFNLKWKFRQLYQRLFYWLEWRFSDERYDPYRCVECGSTDVEIKVWSKLNEGGRYGGDCEEFNRSYCNHCDELVRVRPTDFSTEDGYRAFVDAGNSWWNKLSDEQKIQLWIQN